jgi:hypothetical protein
MLSLQTLKRVLLSSHTAGGPGLLYAPALPFALIHRSDAPIVKWRHS